MAVQVYKCTLAVSQMTVTQWQRIIVCFQ